MLQHCKSEYAAQKIFAEVTAHAEQGTAAKIDSQRILVLDHRLLGVAYSPLDQRC